MLPSGKPLKSHTPQDQLYGPLQIPSYCWCIIDTPEFQRLRYISQLGTCSYVFHCANHSRFEHSLGCCHLATIFMEHFKSVQPELNISEDYKKIVILAALCHDLGHGILSHSFENVCRSLGKSFDHQEMSVKIFNHIINEYKLKEIIPDEIADCVSYAIRGEVKEGYPKYLFTLVANESSDLDIDKFDYLTRDINRTICIQKFEFDRLIVNCRIINGELAWKVSEKNTIERLFFNRIDMHIRVYKHPAVQAVELMITDVLKILFGNQYYDIDALLESPKEYCKLDERLFYKIENNEFNDDEMTKIFQDIKFRKLYKLVGSVKFNVNDVGYKLSQSKGTSYFLDKLIENYKELNGKIRIAFANFAYHSNESHPLKEIPFYDSHTYEPKKLDDKDIFCIVPANYRECVVRVYCTDPDYYSKAKEAAQSWEKQLGEKK